MSSRLRWRRHVNVLLFAVILFVTLAAFLTGDTRPSGSIANRSLAVNCNSSDDTGKENSILDIFKLNNSIESAPKAKVKLIILTYMRSGSSLTGDVYDHHPKAFYIYEPLWSIQKNYVNKEEIIFLNKSYPKPDPSQFNSPSSVAGETLENFLGCKHADLDVKTLGQYHLKRSQTTRDFHLCHIQHPGVLGALRCLPLLVAACRQAEVTVVKTIRYTMAQAQQFMKKDANVKVVHLIRDPRATLNSQARVGEFTRVEVDDASKQFCRRVQDDLQQAERVKAKYPGRVMTARYEDLAAEPLQYAQKLLAFVGLDMTDTLRQYVWNITSAGLPDNCVICTTRNDSKATASKWRKTLPWEAANLMQTNCKSLFDRLGYLPFKTKPEMLNFSVPSLVSLSRVSGLWTP